MQIADLKLWRRTDKNQTKKYRAKKLWFGYAYVRDYVVEECRQKKKDLLISYDKWQMLVPYNQLKDYYFKLHNKTIQSKFDHNYKLIDFKFKPGVFNNGS
jgi:hypothetical protein